VRNSYTPSLSCIALCRRSLFHRIHSSNVTEEVNNTTEWDFVPVLRRGFETQSYIEKPYTFRKANEATDQTQKPPFLSEPMDRLQITNFLLLTISVMLICYCFSCYHPLPFPLPFLLLRTLYGEYVTC
jgi:hypothetical protein